MNFMIDHNLCLNSAYDINVVRRGLVIAGHTEVDTSADADYLIYGACGVRGVWIDEALSRIAKLLGSSPQLRAIATSCGPKIEPARFLDPIPGRSMESLAHQDVLARFAAPSFNKVEVRMGFTRPSDLPRGHSDRDTYSPEKIAVIQAIRSLPSVPSSQLERSYMETTKGFLFYHDCHPSALVAVSRGCPYHCSFCAIPKGRGPHTCVPFHAIEAQVRSAAQTTVRRLYLLGEDVGSYRCPSTTRGLQGLLSMVGDLQTLKIGLRYLEPMSFLRHYDAIRQACEHGLVSLIYLPIQSGSHRVLKAMNRKTDLVRLAEGIHDIQDSSSVAFYTNWLVGFPTEQDADFEQTLALAHSLALDVNVVIPYSERPDTAALEIEPKVPIDTKRARVQRLRAEMAALKASRLLDGIEGISTESRLLLSTEIVKAELASTDDLID